MASNYASYASNYYSSNHFPNYTSSNRSFSEPIRIRSQSYNDLGAALNKQSPYYLPQLPAPTAGKVQLGPMPVSYSKPNLRRSLGPMNQNSVGSPPPMPQTTTVPATLSRYRGKHIRAASMNAALEDSIQHRPGNRYRNPESIASISSSEASVDSDSLQTQTSMSSAGSVYSGQSGNNESNKVRIDTIKSLSSEKPLEYSIEAPQQNIRPTKRASAVPKNSTIKPVGFSGAMNITTTASPRANDVTSSIDAAPEHKNSFQKRSQLSSSERIRNDLVANGDLNFNESVSSDHISEVDDINKTLEEKSSNTSSYNTKLILPSDNRPKSAILPSSSDHIIRLRTATTETNLTNNSQMPSKSPAGRSGSPNATGTAQPLQSNSGLRAPKSTIINHGNENENRMNETTLSTKSTNGVSESSLNAPQTNFMTRSYQTGPKRSETKSMPPGSVISRPVSRQETSHNVEKRGNNPVKARTEEVSPRSSRSLGAKLMRMFGSDKRSRPSNIKNPYLNEGLEDDARSTISTKSNFSIRSVSSFMSIGGKFRRKKSPEDAISVNKTTTASDRNVPRTLQPPRKAQDISSYTPCLSDTKKAGSIRVIPSDDDQTASDFLVPRAPSPALRSTLKASNLDYPDSRDSATNKTFKEDGIDHSEADLLAPPNLGAGDIFPGNLMVENVESIVSSVERTGSFKRQPSTSRRTEEEVVPNAEEIEVDTPSVIENSSPKLKSALKAPKTVNLRKRSGAGSSLSVSFASQILVYKTYSETEYNRKTGITTCDMLKIPGVTERICHELNYCKARMEVHPDSKSNTHFFIVRNK